MAVIFCILQTLLNLVSYTVMPIVNAVFKFLYRKKSKTVTKVVDPLLLMPAVDLASKIRNRELSVENVMAAYICRAKEVNTLVNAIVGEQYDAALCKAQSLDEQLDAMTPEQIQEDYSEEKKPFLGVPLSVKESMAWTGMANSGGIVARKHIRATKDAPVVSAFIKAGAIPFIQTNISEVCMWYESSNCNYGCTQNAYDTSRMVGGSSGGEGCIISCGASVIGIGSDIGGSIRMPCFFNGIFGHKPTPGIVDNSDQFPETSKKTEELLSTGPMCRYASDLLPAFRVLARPEKLPSLQLDAEVDLGQIKVISVPDDAGSLMVSSVSKELKEAQTKAATFLASKGATVTEQHFKKFRHSVEMWSGKMNLIDDEPPFSELMSGQAGEAVNTIKELFLWFLGFSEHTLPAIALGIITDYLTPLTKAQDIQATKALAKLREELVALMGNNTVLLYPSHPNAAPYHSHPLVTPFNFAYTALFNALGFPVSQCPLGLNKEGLPIGFQVIATPYNDHLCLAIAKHLEKGFNGWVSPGL